MRFLYLTGVAGLAMFATAATAQQAADPRPFNGPYVGASVGFAAQPNDVGEGLQFDRNLDGAYTDTVTTATGANAFSPGFCNGAARGATPASGCRNDKDGVDYYGRAGWDFQRGSIVFGVVGEFGKAEINDSVSGFSTTPASYTMTRRLSYEGTIRARAGYAFNQTLFYGTGGPGYAKIGNRFRSTNVANAFTARDSGGQWGFTAGGGIEQKLTRHISIGLEYMFHRYKDDDYRVRVTRGSAPATNPFVLAPNTTGTDLRRNFDYFRWHSLRGTVAFRF